MKERMIILITTAVLLTAIIGFGVYHHVQSTPKTTAANAVVHTGLSMVFADRLANDVTARISDSAGKTVRDQKLEAGASRFNVALKPGVYRLEIRSQKSAIIEPVTVTVTNGQVTQLSLSLSKGD